MQLNDLTQSTKSTKFLYPLFFLAVVSVLFPRQSVGGLSLGVDDALTPFGFIWVSMHWINKQWRLPGLGLSFIVITFTYFIFIFTFFGFLNQWVHQVDFKLPTELWQYLKRLTFFLIGFYFVFLKTSNFEKATKLFIWVFSIALSIGLLQYFNDGLGELLAKLYARTDHQLERLVYRSADVSRVYGVSGFSTSWGGISAFIFVFFSSLALTKMLSWRYSFFLLLIILAALLNVVFSGSRVALVAAFFGLLMILMVSLFDKKVGTGRKLSIIGVMTAGIYGMIFLMQDRLAFIIYRFVELQKQQGGGRIDQIQSGLSLLNSPETWVFGVGNAVQRQSSISYGIEVEPIYLLVNYGLVGLLLLVGILFYLFCLSLKLCFHKSDKQLKFAGYALMSSISVYMVFWLGYFFFQEIVVGLPFWLFSGSVLGLSYAREKEKNWSKKFEVR